MLPRTHQQRARTCALTRSAKSADAASSMGTAIAPRKAHPKKAATHSAQFSPQNITRSPLRFRVPPAPARIGSRYRATCSIAPPFRAISPPLHIASAQRRHTKSSRKAVIETPLHDRSNVARLTSLGVPKAANVDSRLARIAGLPELRPVARPCRKTVGCYRCGSNPPPGQSQVASEFRPSIARLSPKLCRDVKDAVLSRVARPPFFCPGGKLRMSARADAVARLALRAAHHAGKQELPPVPPAIFRRTNRPAATRFAST